MFTELILSILLPAVQELPIIPYSIDSPQRQLLMREYNKMHYGWDDFLIQEPTMIIIHCTEDETIEETLFYFKAPSLAKDSFYQKKFGWVNISSHFIVDLDGTIYSLIPVTQTARHCIGFNYISIGIENVALKNEYLTAQQVTNNALLVVYLKKLYPSIEYLAGHYEIPRKDLPHYRYWREDMPEYKFYTKTDPGDAFMAELRKLLKEKYRLEFLN